MPDAPATGTPPTSEAVWLPRWTRIGLVLLFLSACAFGMMEVHSSTDTWIGLAAGRQIVSEWPKFPVKDTFSYTFYGQTWFNQNWLSHVYFWLLYDKLGPDAVIYGTWALSVLTFAFVLLATKLRSGSWLGATITASVIAIGCRDWFSARPATVQFFCAALLWLCISGLLGQTKRRRWWPIIVLVPLFIAWTHAHGSFVLGYALLAMLVGCDIFQRVVRQKAVLSGWQLVAIIAIALATVGLGVLMSPYGLDNLWHPSKVAESEAFRQVSEWVPPYREARFPRVEKFWVMLAAAFISLIVTVILRAYAVTRAQAARAQAPRPSSSERHPWLELILFDALSVCLGLGMALFARRFAPFFYILAGPALATWTLRLAKPLSTSVRGYARDALILLAWPAAGLTLQQGLAVRAYPDLVAPFRNGGRQVDLLERVTAAWDTPNDGIEFLRRNDLTVNLFVEWTQAGLVMFHVPHARVFMDGRAQQLYSERQYMAYNRVLNFPPADEHWVVETLASSDTDAALLRRTPSAFRLAAVLERDPGWTALLDTPREMMFVRRDSALIDELARRERAGTLWWPDYPESLASRGRLLITTMPMDIPRAVALGQAAVAAKPVLGLQCYRWMTVALRHDGRDQDAAAFLEHERRRFSQPVAGLPEDARAALLDQIRRCEALLANPMPPAGGG